MTKIFLLILASGFALCGSTTNSADTTLSQSSNSVNKKDLAEDKKPSQTVQTFMELIAAGENEKAKALMSTEPKVGREEGGPSTYQEAVRPFDWVTVLADRKFRLKKILSERSEGDEAYVEADLNPEDLKSFIQRAVFELTKDGDEWRISDVDLVDKAATMPPKTDGSR
jgi:hypothetical protein